MSHLPVPIEERWLHAVSGSAASELATWADVEPVGLLDAPVMFGLYSRSDPVGAEAHDHDGHEATYGPRPSGSGLRGDVLLDAVAQRELTGRGGGHFPVAAKWRAALSAGGGGLVVANGAEGEPASVKDAALLQLRPHLVLDGLALAAEVLGTRHAVVWLHAGDLATHRSVSRALVERASRGDLGIEMRIAVGPDHYLTGESSSIVRGLGGGPALPLLARRPAAVEGVGGRPTVVHNVETLARVGLAARNGDADGALVTVVGPRSRVVYSVSDRDSLGRLLADAGAAQEAFQAVLVGGYGGAWLPWPHAAHVPLSERSLREEGVSLGAGVIAPLPRGACGLSETSRLLDFLAASSARQCGPCLFGLPALADIFRRLAHARASRSDLKTLARYSAEINGRGACHHPDGAVRLARTALHCFADDVRRHTTSGPCPGASGPPILPVPEVA